MDALWDFLAWVLSALGISFDSLKTWAGAAGIGVLGLFLANWKGKRTGRRQEREKRMKEAAEDEQLRKEINADVRDNSDSEHRDRLRGWVEP